MKYTLKATDGAARRGELSFARGTVQTPAFMPVGTYGTVKAMLPRDIEASGAEIMLGNTFHLMLRPGDEIVRDQGGLHPFIGWERPILTDSGGFQVFSLGNLRKISEAGVVFETGGTRDDRCGDFRTPSDRRQRLDRGHHHGGRLRRDGGGSDDRSSAPLRHRVR